MQTETIRTPERGQGSPPRLAAVRAVLRGNPLVAPAAILAVLLVVFSILNPLFISSKNIITLLDNAAVPMVIAVGLTFIILTGSIDLSVEGVMATVSITISLLLANTINDQQFGFYAVLIGLAIGLAFGLANGILYTKLRLPSLIVTLGTWFIGLGIAAYLFPGNPPTITDSGFRAFSLSRWFGVEPLVFVALAVVIIATLVLRYTRFGRMLYGIGGNETLVSLAGVKVDRYKIAAFTIAGFLSALAGIMITAKLGIGNVTAGSNQLFPAISAVVVGGTLLSGGRGSIGQTVLGVLILTVLGNGMILSGVSPYIQQAVIGVIIVTAVVIATWRNRRPLRIIK